MVGRIIRGAEDLAEGAAWLAARDARFGQALAAVGDLPLRLKPDGFSALMDAIISQQVSVASANAIRARMARYTGPMLSPIPTLQVALPVPLPRMFDYLSPEGDGPTVAVGCRLKVPFGNRELVGMVEGIGTVQDPAPLREALQWLDGPPLLGGELYASLRWLARYHAWRRGG